jgi:predicted small secreted protein
MNKAFKRTPAIMIVVLLMLAMASACNGGGNSPKSLAKQYVDTAKQMLELTNYGDPETAIAADPGILPKIQELEKKMLEIEQKVEQLSEVNQEIFVKKFEKLSKAAGLPDM